MTITVLVPDEYGLTALSQVDGVHPVRYDPSGGDLPAEAAQAQVMVQTFLAGSERFDAAALPKLELVQLLTAGAERWLGVLPEHVMLSTARGAHGGSTAEWVVGGLLSIYRELGVFQDRQRAADWDQHGTDTLWHKRVLIVGAGDLARELVRRLDGFDATATLVGTRARDGVHGIDEVPDLLGEHDVVVLVVPLTTETTGMVDAEFLARMPEGAILVNAARGPVVDTDALVAELTAGRLRALLDVTDPEPLPADHPLWTAPGLLLTPHVAGSTLGHRERAYAVVVDEITRYVAGEQPRNLVRGQY